MRLDWQVLDAAALPTLRDDEIQLHLVPRADANGWRDALVAAALARPAASLEYRREAHGRPYVVDAGDAPAYNLAHTGRHALLALARGTAVGVDLEAPRRVARRAALLARVFCPSERAAIAAAPEPGRLLLHAWAGKEAVVKAIGRGIAYGLARIELELDAAGVRGVRTLEGPAAAFMPWSVVSFDVPGDHLGALAWHGGPRSVRAWCTGEGSVPGDAPHRRDGACGPLAETFDF
ncbi:MAG TPA: 4'-phosphopantetheinyl transferase superfamily protein [Candidatus Saccharimonadia bacterium]|nr:4'-phosphopantetheinyl transferase superfamily protein [Candidatus Saccharimonadia bacterium]